MALEGDYDGIYLDRVDKVFRVSLELPLALIQLIWAGGDHTAGTDRCLGDIAMGGKSERVYDGVIDEDYLPRCNGKQIAGDWDRLVEAVQLVSRLGGHGRLANGQTTGHDRERGGDVKVKSAFNIGGILAREDRPGMDSLALRD